MDLYSHSAVRSMASWAIIPMGKYDKTLKPGCFIFNFITLQCLEFELLTALATVCSECLGLLNALGDVRVCLLISLAS